MKNWGSRISDAIGYLVIGWTMGLYSVTPWDSVKLLLTILFIQAVVRFVKEVIEY